MTIARAFAINSSSFRTIRCLSAKGANPLSFARRFLSDYAAVVAGSGPAGIAAVGNLLEQKIPGKVLWADPELAAGKLNKTWREVPSNTKVHLFVNYAKAIETFREVIEKTPSPNAVTTLESLDQEKCCQISYAADVCLMLSKGLCEFEQVDEITGKITGANWNSASSKWTVEVATRLPKEPVKSKTVSSSRLIFCTGSIPNALPIPVSDLNIKRLDLDKVLQPSKLKGEFLKQAPATIAVVGASHSAILVLLNLYSLATKSRPQLRVLWFTRNPLRYAEYKDGWILRDNTGLKGDAATFAKENLEDSKLSSSPVGKYVQKIDCSEGKEQEQYEKYLPECTHIVQAIGFSLNPLPMLTFDGNPIGQLQFDHVDGTFSDKNGNTVPGLYGAGIAFPERVTDPLGNVEYNVGLGKFMKFLKRVAVDWVGKSQTSTGGT